MLNLSLLLENSARTHPDHPALVFADRRWTYAEVEADANRVANLLMDRGVRPGDRVALACPNLPSFPAIYFGILKVGAVVIPMNVLNKRDDFAYSLADSGATVFFCYAGTDGLAVGAEGLAAFEQTPGCRHFIVIPAGPGGLTIDGQETLETLSASRATTFETVPRQEMDPAVILYTSGTTGQPKGATLSHSNLLLNAETCYRAFSSAPGLDTHLVVLPLFHSFAATVNMLNGFGSASTLVLVPRFDPAIVLRLLQTQPITFLAAVPTMYWGLLHALPADADVASITHDLRLAISGGASLPVAVIDEFRQRFGATILEAYGLSETSPGTSFTTPGVPPRPGSIGVPGWGIEMKLVDADGKTIEGTDEIGEIAIRGHNVMLGYHNRPEATAEAIRDGWFHTGDVGRRDEDGWYYIVDRLKDMIIRGGYNVYPREIEEVLMRHEAVALAAVIGVPDERLGEEIRAVIVRKPGSDVSADDIVNWARERLPAHKYPRLVTFVAEIPLGPTGKPLKRDLA